MAAHGYPASVRKNDAIHGLDADFSDAKVFHAGTATGSAGEVLTSGGRVLCVCALGETVEMAQRGAYHAVGRIRWSGEHHRSDIGYRAIARADDVNGIASTCFIEPRRYRDHPAA